MRTILIDGREVMVDDEMTGERISELARPGDDQFAVVVRNNGDLPARIPIQKSRHPYCLNDGDVVTNMYRIPTGV